MADVQLEHGHLRIANSLEEAITYAPFTATQMKIVRAIVRLTYGWRQRTVRVSHPDLAKKCNLTAAGGFRRSLDELIRHGVLVEVERPSGRLPGAYALNKDFENWGEFSVAAKTLETLYGERPPSADKVPSEGHTIEVPPAGESDRSVAPQGTSHDPTGRDNSPQEVMIKSVSDSNGNGLEPPKDIERQERQLLHDRAGIFARKLVGAANNANAERYGEWTRTRPYYWATATQLCTELLLLGVDEDGACRAVADAIRASKKDKPAFTIAYFANSITDAHKATEQRALDRENPAPAVVKRGGKPQPVAKVFNPNDDRLRHKLETEYASARTAAVREWSEKPENKARYHAITSAANQRFADTLSSALGRRGRDAHIVIEAAKAMGFPMIDDWLAESDRSSPPALTGTQ